MKTRYLICLISLVCLAALGACKGSEPENTAQTPQTQAQPPQPDMPAPNAEQFVAGELLEIDPGAMTIVLKDPKGTEQKLAYSPTTKITGIPKPAELGRQEGRNATIRYVERDNLKSAIQIHIEAGS
jgi:hypothetical protein